MLLIKDRVKFYIENGNGSYLEIATDKLPLICGVTFLTVNVRSKEIDKVMTKETSNLVNEYVLEENRNTIDGIFSGSYAIHPIFKTRLPIYIVDYTKEDVHMAIPAHDKDDFKFAKKYGVEIRQVVAPVTYGKGEDTLKPGKIISKRENVNAIIKHPTKEEYIVLNWKNGWTSFVIGGINENETHIDAAIREMIEETGYYEIKNAYEIMAINYNRAYIYHKDVNRYAVHYPVVLELSSLKTKPVKEEDTTNHTFEWIEKTKLYDYLNLENQKFIADIFVNGERNLNIDGELINSGEFNELNLETARIKIKEYLSI